ncbi:VWA domain-containing protein [Skermania sp. ID1734]|uniref:substrate-binding domain-containing protein n=1 Tax=Skermania sp. ID1734 TaxID=2597516 RepID=UPI001180F1D2|nr:substrate-binding domain-containing protein [Skermania sp. ID1734]TSE01410.1 VWA domain-containing protein [Skermania sp. ID1734]
MGQHRDNASHRRVSKGPIIGLCIIAVVALLVFGWFRLRHNVSQQVAAASHSCVQGTATVPVLVDPTVGAQIRSAADGYNATTPVVGDYCIHISVTALPSDAVRMALGGPQWDTKLGAAPAMWIPQSSVSLRGLTIAQLASEPQSVTTSPYVLAVPKRLADELDSKRASWRDIAAMQSDPGLLPAWGGLRLALPADDAATVAIASAVGTSAAAGPLSAQSLATPAVHDAVATLIGHAPASTNPGEPLKALAAQPDPAAPVHAVAVTRQQLSAAHLSALSEFTPTGSTPVANYPAAVLHGDGPLGDIRARAAALFADYLRKPEQQHGFRDAGFATAPRAALQPAPPAVLNQLADLVAHPQPPVNSTVVIDVSASMNTDSRLATVISALRDALGRSADDARIGLWTYSTGQQPYRVLVEPGMMTPQQRATLDRSLAGVRADDSTADNAYPTVEAAYRDAVANYQAGRGNSVLLITDGPNDVSAVTGAQLLSAVTVDTSKPVHVNVLAIGDGNATTRSLASQTGGTFVAVHQTSEIPGAIARLFSA